ncbi:MAG: GNAT family N-acetyltransferase [Phycisphaerae bacterium]
MGQIETVEPADREEVLARVLAPLSGAACASRAHVKSFVSYLSACALDWTAWRYRRGPRETALLFVLFLPGETAIAMFPAPEARGIVPADQRRLLVAGLERLAGRALYYVQALVEPNATGKRNLLQASGFGHLTQLIYLQRRATFPWFDPPGAQEATWIAYNERRHDMFAQMLLVTYEDSRDCPELTGLRSIDAVIASHKAAGEFNPALWEIACVNGEHAGCILLSPLIQGPVVEVVYMGVASRWRRRGVGKLLLRRALQHCRAVGASELTAVVDRRNRPARQLYARFGFKPTAAREAYIYSW